MRQVWFWLLMQPIVVYTLLVLVMIYGWGMWPRSWAWVVIGYPASWAVHHFIITRWMAASEKVRAQKDDRS
jgi:hypothetical protein